MTITFFSNFQSDHISLQIIFFSFFLLIIYLVVKWSFKSLLRSMVSCYVLGVA